MGEVVIGASRMLDIDRIFGQDRLMRAMTGLNHTAFGLPESCDRFG
jgi:hypothetical protein